MAAWNPESDRRLRDLWEQGITTVLIGQAMGISKNAVIGRAHRLELPLRANPIKRRAVDRPVKVQTYVRQPWKVAEVELRRMWANGLSTAQIAKGLGRTLGSVSARLSRLGMTSHQNRRVVASQPEMVTMPPAQVVLVAPAASVVVQLPTPKRWFVTQQRPSAPRLQPTVKAAVSQAGPGPARSCQYPLTDARPWRFCGEVSVSGLSWCGCHAARVFVQKRQASEAAA